MRWIQNLEMERFKNQYNEVAQKLNFYNYINRLCKIY